MQRTIYECDKCGTDIGKNPHVSLSLALHTGQCGIAVPPEKEKGPWKVTKFNRAYIHFCNGTCAGAYFQDRIDEATKTKEV